MCGLELYHANFLTITANVKTLCKDGHTVHSEMAIRKVIVAASSRTKTSNLISWVDDPRKEIDEKLFIDKMGRVMHRPLPAKMAKPLEILFPLICWKGNTAGPCFCWSKPFVPLEMR
jgi:hypothetical protein